MPPGSTWVFLRPMPPKETNISVDASILSQDVYGPYPVPALAPKICGRITSRRVAITAKAVGKAADTAEKPLQLRLCVMKALRLTNRRIRRIWRYRRTCLSRGLIRL